MKLKDCTTEEAIALATSAAKSMLKMDYRGGFQLPGEPKVSIDIRHDPDDYSTADVRIDSWFKDDSEYDFQNVSGMGQTIPDTLACLLFGLQLELQERIKQHTAMLEKVKACVDLTDTRNIEEDEANSGEHQ